MLTIYSSRNSPDCAGQSRRDFLRVGALGLGGLTLANLLAGRAAAAKAGGYVNDKAVVLLFLGGGPSHIETFNPNMQAPEPSSSVTGEVATSLPGVTFGGTFPQLAQHAHKMALVRSFTHPIGDHVKAIAHVLSGGADRAGDGKEGYSMGAVYSRLRGANHPRTGLPTYAILTSGEIDGQYRNEKSRIENGSRPGSLGQACAAFDPSGGNTALRNMQLKIAAERLDDRRALLKGLDTLNRQVDASGLMAGLDKFEEQAVELILGGASEAFNLKRESRQTIERYDTSKFRVGKKVFQPSELGRQLLLARRLCEAGCGFVTVQNSGWDMHADGNNPGVAPGMEMLGRPLDKAVSAFLEDLENRGLADKVLLIITGDFGRTPTINKNGGRDHWPKLCTLALAGGGLKMGQVIGQSSKKNDVPATDPISTPNLMATVLHTLFDPAVLRLDPAVPRELAQLVERGEPIRALFG